jgi:hypothetical protein
MSGGNYGIEGRLPNNWKVNAEVPLQSELLPSGIAQNIIADKFPKKRVRTLSEVIAEAKSKKNAAKESQDPAQEQARDKADGA